jgi:thiol:disulfide interchange protein
VAVRAELDAARTTDQEALRTIVADEVAKAQAGKAIRWRHPGTVAEVEQLLAEAQRDGKPALLDFTGPSCVNCQKMAKSVFRDPRVVAAWNRGVPIAIDTDPPHDALAQWQQERFQTQNRPLYVRLDPVAVGQPAHPAGGDARWSEVFEPTNAPAMERFLAFLGGGTGSDAGGGSGLGEFIALALLGGLFTLVMPCTYPMIPFTLNFFAKQAAGGRRLVPLAAFYAFGIIACFVALGVLITGVFGSTLATVSGHPVTNLVIALLFVVLGLSLLGAFFLRLPAALEGSMGGSRGGYLGALIMGLTFAVTAFTCTAPFAGSVLAQAVATGSWVRAMLGMAVYASAIALPFFALAISPGALARIPRAGAWMNEFKVVGGLIELAAALKFLAICDNAWHWGVVGRTFTIAAWAAVALLIACYVLGKVRMAGDAPVAAAGVGRTMLAITFLAVGLWLAAGLAGHNLGVLESFFPGDAAP